LKKACKNKQSEMERRNGKHNGINLKPKVAEKQELMFTLQLMVE